MKLQLAKDLALPIGAVTQTIAILGVRGSGKTNTGVVFAEELLDAKQQVVILDPVDVWWGLKSSKDGKKPGFSIPVVGGEHADVPLDAAGGTVLADFAVDNRASIILALRHLSMNDQRKFATDFAKRLYERKGTAENRSPVMLIVDEADEFVPQRLPHGHEAMFGAFDRLVRRGRSSGIGVTLISQRAQVINKDVLSQMETLIGMRMLHKLDREALKAWIEAHDTEGRQEEFMASLASLGRGDAWVWSPEWLGVFQRSHIRERQTFDSSATPKAGEHVAPPKEIAPVDLERLKERMAATIERAKADDPRELRRQIAELQKAAKAKAAAPAKADPPGKAAANREALEKAAARGALAMSNKMAREIRDVVRPVRSIMEQAVSKLRTLATQLEEYIPPDPLEFKSAVDLPPEPDPPAGRPERFNPGRPVRRPVPSAGVPDFVGDRRAVTQSDPAARLPIGERAILTACAQYPEGATREQLSILTGYKRSSRDAYIQRLKEKGFVEAGNLIVATPDGVAALGPDFQPLPTGQALQDYWLERLPEGERKILAVLIVAYPEAVDRDAIDRQTEYKRSSRDAYIQRLKARQLVEIVGRGEVRASGVLFE